MPAFRSPVALSDAVSRDLQFRFRVAMWIGVGALTVVWLLNGFLLPEGRPDLGAGIGGAGAFVVVTLVAYLAPILATPDERRMLEAVAWSAAESSRRSRDAFGDPRVPSTPKQALAWLRRHPDDTDATRSRRIFACLVLGDLEAARRLVEKLPSGTPAQRYEREAGASIVRFVEGGDPGLESLRETAARLTTDAERFGAEVDLALATALLAAAEDADWRAPVLALRERIGIHGVRALWLLWRTWVPLAVFVVVAAGLLTLAAYSLRALIPG